VQVSSDVEEQIQVGRSSPRRKNPEDSMSQEVEEASMKKEMAPGTKASAKPPGTRARTTMTRTLGAG